MVWDDLARSGIWPIRPGTIVAFLRENKLAGGKGAGFKRIKKFLNHRRTRVLQALVRAELTAWGVPVIHERIQVVEYERGELELHQTP